MALRLITPPAASPISLAEAKVQLRVDYPDEDPLIERLIAAAVQTLDGARGWLGRALLTQVWELDLVEFPRCGRIMIPLPPLVQVDAVTYRDASGAVQTLPAEAYDVLVNGEQPGEIWEATDATWPCVPRHPQAVTVRFTAGYGATASAVPQPIRHALLLLVGHLYENREATAPGTMRPETVPLAFEHLLDPYRVLTIG